MTATIQPKARRLALGVVLGQAAVTVVAAVIGWSLGGEVAARSALVGGGISTVATLAMAGMSFSRFAASGALQFLAAFFAGEFVKIGLVVVGFVLVWKWMAVSPGALLGAFIATLLVYWVALASLLFPLVRGPAPRGG